MAAHLLSPMSALVVAAHMGGLNPFENALVMAIAFGPFVALGVVVAVLRRRDGADDSESEKRRTDG